MLSSSKVKPTWAATINRYNLLIVTVELPIHHSIVPRRRGNYVRAEMGGGGLFSRGLFWEEKARERSTLSKPDSELLDHSLDTSLRDVIVSLARVCVG